MQAEAAEMVCASCGIAEVDEIKLTECDSCDLVRYCSDKCQQDHRMQHKQCAKNGRLNYEARNYSSSLRAHILVTVRSAYCLFRLTISNLCCNHVAANRFAEDVITPIVDAREKNGRIPRVHSVVNSYQTLRKKPTRI